MITNYNFSPLEVTDIKSKEVLTLMAPKETAFINSLDTIN